MRLAVGLGVVLTTIWVLAWGSLTWANLASGIAVSALLLVLVPDVRRATHLPIVRPWPLVGLTGRMLRDAAVSNVLVAWEALSPRPRISTGVVGVPLAGCSDEVLTIIASLVALTPGTMPVEVEQDPTVMYVHVLHMDDPEQVRRRIWSLRDQVVATFGTTEAIAEVERVKAESLRGAAP
jgi:multicomponent Na+:H+ antiporter subunit E